jgi:outer membrane receptor protein involved in Fe transport
VEASVKAQYDRRVDGYVNYTFTEATFRSRFSDFGGTGAAGQTVEVGDSVPMVPKHMLALGASYHPVEGVTAAFNGVYVSTKFLFGDEANAEKRLPGYFLLNARLAYERKVPTGKIGAFLQVNNLLDTKYETLGRLAFNFTTFATEPFMIPAPGISVFGGLSYRFEGF